MKKRNFLEFEHAFKSKKTLKMMPNGVEMISSDDEDIPSFIFSASNGFTFYMPYFLFSPSLFAGDPQSLHKALSKYAFSYIDFLVEDIDYDNKMGIVSHVALMEQEKQEDGKIFFANPEGTVYDVKIMYVSADFIEVEFAGYRKRLYTTDFPRISSLVLSDVFTSGKTIQCRIQMINPNSDSQDINNLKLIPLEYPQIPEDFQGLKVNSYYNGQVIGIRKQNSGVTVNCFGNRTFCEYPTNFIPVIGMNVVIKVLLERKDRDNSYVGKIIFCEAPVGS